MVVSHLDYAQALSSVDAQLCGPGEAVADRVPDRTHRELRQCIVARQQLQ